MYLLTEIDTDHDTAVVAQKIADAVQLPFQLSIGELTIKPSIGIAIFPRDGTSLSALMKSADTAMYKAKQMNKNNYQFLRDTHEMQHYRELHAH